MKAAHTLSIIAAAFGASVVVKALRPADRRAIGKVPIEL